MLLPLPSPHWQSLVCFLYLWVCFCLLYTFILFFRFHIYCICHFLSGLFHIIPSRSIHVVANGKISFFLITELCSIIYICVYTYIYIDTHTPLTSSLSICLLMDIYVASISWQLYIMPLWTLGCMYLLKLVFFDK